MSKYINADMIRALTMAQAEAMLRAIENPAADVVEVVRCRDCKHLIGWDESHPHDFIYKCDRRIIKNNVLLDDFCSYGERKESKVKKCFDIPKEVAEMLLEDTERTEEMSKYINADKLCEDLMTRWKIADEKKEKEIQSIMADIVVPIVTGQPSADVKENAHGEWLERKDKFGITDGLMCSLCGRCTYQDYPNFCSNCGADMRGKQNEK